MKAKKRMGETREMRGFYKRPKEATQHSLRICEWKYLINHNNTTTTRSHYFFFPNTITSLNPILNISLKENICESYLSVLKFYKFTLALRSCKTESQLHFSTHLSNQVLCPPFGYPRPKLYESSLLFKIKLKQ